MREETALEQKKNKVANREKSCFGFKFQTKEVNQRQSIMRNSRSVLDTNRLKHFLHYDVQEPYFVRLPTDSGDGARTAMYDDDSRDLPDILIDLSSSSSLIVIYSQSTLTLMTKFRIIFW